MSMDDFKKACKKIQTIPLGNAQTQSAHPSETPTTPTTPTTAATPAIPANPAAPSGSGSTEIVKRVKVKANTGYTAFIKRQLEEQGIAVTPDNITKAKSQFEAINVDKDGNELVGTYNGKKQEWQGNRFLHLDVTYKVPKFNV